MLTKTITPIFGESYGGSRSQRAQSDNYQDIIKATVIKYRLFGILIYKKTLFTPEGLGHRYYTGYFTSF